MSRKTTETCLTSGFLPRTDIPDKQSRIWDFVPARSFPLFDNEGGYLEFSYLKNSSVLESGRACRETNICITTAVDALHDASLSVHWGWSEESIEI